MALSREEHFFRGDADITADYDASLKRAFPLNAEKMLMLAVLEEAVDCYKRNLFAKERRAKKLYAETEDWLLARDEDVLFSFENVCEQLTLDPDYLRAGLRRWKETQIEQRLSELKARQGRQRNKSRGRKHVA